ncbi:uncharacterized protein FIBRA_03121 [Fibroporia radiculosa]|uniref:Uncharacterized protein n=1 Tax=Fibroporia radiculosa TaxID=599839 RepID=J4G489_9APHY|nr:uncharacterized protein FIBRA_03121 [Fibroporia radiculosa]CCM01073.1 predicted protein [Fibroporia radiculosa]
MTDGALECTKFLRRIIAPRLSVLCTLVPDSELGQLGPLTSLLTTKLSADASLDIIQHDPYLYVGYGLDSPTSIETAIGIDEDEAVHAWMKTMASSKGGFVGVRRQHNATRWVGLDAPQFLFATHPKTITHLGVYMYKDLDHLLSTLGDYPTCIPSLRVLELNYSGSRLLNPLRPLDCNKINILESIKRCLAKRTVTGLEELRLVGCPLFTMCDIDDMKRLVKSVRVVQ